MALDCTLRTLLTAAKTYKDFAALSPNEREAIEVYLMVKSLTAAGGTNYANPTALQAAAKEWQVVSPDQLAAIKLAIQVQNAIANGASVSTNVTTLKAQSKCYQCLGLARIRQLALFLKCQINALGKPD